MDAKSCTPSPSISPTTMDGKECGVRTPLGNVSRLFAGSSTACTNGAKAATATSSPPHHMAIFHFYFLFFFSFSICKCFRVGKQKIRKTICTFRRRISNVYLKKKEKKKGIHAAEQQSNHPFSSTAAERINSQREPILHCSSQIRVTSTVMMSFTKWPPRNPKKDLEP